MCVDGVSRRHFRVDGTALWGELEMGVGVVEWLSVTGYARCTIKTSHT